MNTDITAGGVVHVITFAYMHTDCLDVYCILNHPVQSVQVMGDVISVQQKSRLVEYKGKEIN